MLRVVKSKEATSRTDIWPCDGGEHQDRGGKHGKISQTCRSKTIAENSIETTTKILVFVFTKHPAAHALVP